VINLTIEVRRTTANGEENRKSPSFIAQVNRAILKVRDLDQIYRTIGETPSNEQIELESPKSKVAQTGTATR